MAPPIKILAKENDIPVFQPENIKSEIENITQLNPELIVVIAYGQIIPQAILDIPKYGCINVHASLLPAYRGASCLQAPILNGDKETGVTIMKMDAQMDTGAIIKQFTLPLEGTENLSYLHDHLSQLSAKILAPTLQSYCQGKIKIQAQDNNKASYVKLVKKEDGQLNPNKDALILERQIRAYQPWPGTYLLLSDKEKIKILQAEIKIINHNKKIGEIYLENGELLLACGQNALHILKLQRENRNALPAPEFLKGNPDIIGLIAK